jgi:uncharacterized membrane protein
VDDWLLLGLLGVLFLVIAGVLELRARQYGDQAPPRLRTASIIIAVIGIIELVIAVLLRFV